MKQIGPKQYNNNQKKNEQKVNHTKHEKRMNSLNTAENKLRRTK